MTSLDIKIKDRLAKVKLISKDKSKLTVMVDNKKYEVDIEKVGGGIYSILHKNHSYNVELIETKDSKSYQANTFYQTFDIEIQDAETRYMHNRNKADSLGTSKVISSPMPGRVVKIMVSKGEKLTAGQTTIIVSAMKMESEYKSPMDAVVKDIMVKEGDIVSANQPLIILE
ncbi:MAG: acetyl-CoA carboxylase biotin carboxyl carrier protein subunit [Bacteroidia bacterium]|nr:acetyl-CoA carboxylase biotin carboxyl carrier protein subunit [Bacteroidia bacterium]